MGGMIMNNRRWRIHFLWGVAET